MQGGLAFSRNPPSVRSTHKLFFANERLTGYGAEKGA